MLGDSPQQRVGVRAGQYEAGDVPEGIQPSLALERLGIKRRVGDRDSRLRGQDDQRFQT